MIKGSDIKLLASCFRQVYLGGRHGTMCMVSEFNEFVVRYVPRNICVCISLCVKKTCPFLLFLFCMCVIKKRSDMDEGFADFLSDVFPRLFGDAFFYRYRCCFV